MQLVIRADKQIAAIQADFSYVFPFLKLEFFWPDRVRSNWYPVTAMIPNNTRIKTAYDGKIKEGVAEISGNMTVFELENLFMNRFGLSVQVFRKSGNVWLETVKTDNWTLQQQNNHGGGLSGDTIDREELDYDLSRDAED